MKLLAETFWRSCLALHRAWLAAHARRDLRDLSDRTLKDIGLTRGQVDALFR